ncbi:MAG: hypothetical protein A4S09_04795 [Proteobacteria bacterium SG_bin7]|nr:MAG: hypothetical protein A4S09_04795 [Proteobacteria bacterium SG_bin7]
MSSILVKILLLVASCCGVSIKVRYVLVDADGEFARLLVDHHEPFGFHMHTQLSEDHSIREVLPTTDYNEALQLFLKEVERIVSL